MMRVNTMGWGVLLLTLLALGVSAHAVDPSEQTTLFVDVQLDGEHDSDGDVFTARAVVTNIGDKDAKGVEVELYGNYPPEWVIVPAEVEIQTIPPGESARATFTITRNDQDAVIIALAQGSNTLEASSNRVKVPVHPLVGLALAGSMGGLFILHRKKKESLTN